MHIVSPKCGVYSLGPAGQHHHRLACFLKNVLILSATHQRTQHARKKTRHPTSSHWIQSRFWKFTTFGDASSFVPELDKNTSYGQQTLSTTNTYYCKLSRQHIISTQDLKTIFIIRIMCMQNLMPATRTTHSAQTRIITYNSFKYSLWEAPLGWWNHQFTDLTVCMVWCIHLRTFAMCAMKSASSTNIKRIAMYKASSFQVRHSYCSLWITAKSIALLERLNRWQ